MSKSRYYTGNSPLHIACMRGELGINSLRELLNTPNININLLNRQEETPLHLAAAYAGVTTVSLLLDRGANVDVIDSNDLDPFDQAVISRNLDVAILLLGRSQHADVNRRDSNGDSLLNLAAARGRIDIVSFLLANYSADIHINLQNIYQETALHIALEHSEIIISYMLVRRGADVNTINVDGDTPADIARRLGIPDLARSAEASRTSAAMADQLPTIYEEYDDDEISIGDVDIEDIATITYTQDNALSSGQFSLVLPNIDEEDYNSEISIGYENTLDIDQIPLTPQNILRSSHLSLVLPTHQNNDSENQDQEKQEKEEIPTARLTEDGEYDTGTVVNPSFFSNCLPGSMWNIFSW